MRVLFLDFDGVCNDRAHVTAACAGSTITRWSPELARKTLDPARVARVQRICDMSAARVVIVSGWRRWAPVEEIAAALASAGLRAEVLGAVGGVMFSADLRAEATIEWLAAHPEVTSWCVVDDDRASWHPAITGCEPTAFTDRLVHPRDGITDEDAACAVMILTGRLDIITSAREACREWTDATDHMRYSFDVTWDIEQVVDARGKLWGVVEGVVYLGVRIWTRMESLARMGMATRNGVTILRSTSGDVVTALSAHLRDDGRIAQRLDADEAWLAMERAEGAGEDPEAYEVG